MSDGGDLGCGFARRVNLANLERFAPLLRRPADRSGHNGSNDADGAGDSASDQPSPIDPLLAAAEELFRGHSLRVQVPFTRPARGAGRSGSRESEQPEPMPASAPPATRGPLLWSKEMSRTDAQDPINPDTNPKGGMPLTQAGADIDWTTYFRQTIFGSFPWTISRQQPLVEETHVWFDITAVGSSLGRHRLRISDKQEGEAGQSNYTSTLHWSNITQAIRSLHLTGRTFNLYGPAPGTTEPFFIEIV